MATRTARSVATSPSPSLSTAIGPSPQSPTTPRAPQVHRLRLAAARTGDHPSIHAFLLSVFHGPTAAEFHLQQDEPGYLPANRLIVKHGDQIAAHLRLARQTIQICGRTLPAARFMDLGTAPEFRSRGVATALVAAGQRAAADRGVLIGLARTSAVSLFARHGWSICGRHTYSSASPRPVLVELAARKREEAVQPIFPPMREEPLVIRPLRRIELPAIVRLYAERSRQHAGWPVRSEEYWEWLLARGACDHVYIASTAAESPNMAALLDSVVGYACVRQSRLVELVTTRGRDDANRHLLERICADAREQDGWAIRYDAPVNDSLHPVLCRAGGQMIDNEEHGGEVFMAKVLDPLAVLRKLAPLLATRAAEAICPPPFELGLELRTVSSQATSAAAGIVERCRIKLTASEATIETGGPSRHAVTLAATDLAPLLLGYKGAAELADAGRLKATTAKARAASAALFPAGLWYRPALDDLLAS